MATNSSQHLGLHLWEPTDQVLRTEFNENWTKIDTAVNTAQETTEEAANQLWDGMSSLAERDLLALRAQADGGGTADDAHLFYNRLDSQADAQVLTGARWSAAKHIFLGVDTRPTLEDFKAASTGSGMGYIFDSSFSNGSAYYYFTAPGSAQFTSWSFMVMMFFLADQAHQIDLQFELRAERKSGSSWTVCAQPPLISLHLEGEDTTTTWTPVALDFTAQAGEQYRMVLQLKAGSGVSGAFGFTSSDSDSSLYTNNIQAALTPLSITQGSHSKALSTAGAHRALLLARYNAQPGQGGVSAQWNGQPLEAALRDGADRDGQPCRELRALARGPFPDSSTLNLDLSCGPEDDLALLDYAVYLL